MASSLDVSATQDTALVRVPSAPEALGHFANGSAQALSGAAVEVCSPYTGARLGQVPDGTAVDVDAIVASARAAAPGWAATPFKERCAVLARFRQRVSDDLDRLAHGAACESGKTVAEARAGLDKGLEVVEYAVSLQNLEQGGSLEVSRGVRCEVRREPLGVVAGITPFNFPAMVPMWMFPIALALGNAFVLKPSEKVPFTAMRLAEHLHAAGVPAGVFSVVHGGPVVVEALVDHRDIAACGFVGSSRVAASVYARAAAAGKRALALGGAKNTMILLPDADPEVAISGIVASFTGCAGQRCMAGSLLVCVGECDTLVEGIVARASSLRLGQDMGALIDAAALSRLRAAVATAVNEGATLRLDGRRAKAPPGYEGGHWLGPSVLDHVHPESSCAKAELFGPVLSITRVDTLEAALAIERASPYGNATSVFTQSGPLARRVSDAATSGMIGINVGVPVPREPFSFGGTKASRFGHGDITGQGGVELWSQQKKITTKWAMTHGGSWMS